MNADLIYYVGLTLWSICIFLYAQGNFTGLGYWLIVIGTVAGGLSGLVGAYFNTRREMRRSNSVQRVRVFLDNIGAKYIPSRIAQLLCLDQSAVDNAIRKLDEQGLIDRAGDYVGTKRR